MLPTKRVGTAVFHEHFSLQWDGGIGDVFMLDASPRAALPPWLWGRVVYEAGKVLQRLRPGSCVWLRIPPVEETGRWWRAMIMQSVRTALVPVAITSETPVPQDFHYPPTLHSAPMPPGKIANTPLLSAIEGTIVGVMARIGSGYTAEVASLAMASLPTTRRVLHGLKRKKIVAQETQEKWPYWKITRRGLSVALRMWGVPKGAKFQARAERQSQTAYKHRRTARLWNAWLQKAGYRVLGGWSEVLLPGVGRFAPDALAWGYAEGVETLFWLEVEGGHRSRDQIAAKTYRRLLVAQGFARKYGMHLVFVVLGMPWVATAAVRGMINLESFTAGLVSGWHSFGVLPPVYWGQVRVM